MCNGIINCDVFNNQIDNELVQAPPIPTLHIMCISCDLYSCNKTALKVGEFCSARVLSSQLVSGVRALQLIQVQSRENYRITIGTVVRNCEYGSKVVLVNWSG